MRRCASPASRATSKRHRPPERGARAPDPARRRPCRPQSRRRHRTAARTVAAAPGVSRRAISRRRRRCINAIDRMMPMLRFFRQSDGTFAHFNGMGATPVDLLLTLLAYDDARGAPLSNAPHSGYQRLEAGGAVLIDGYRPPAADRDERSRPMPAACRSSSRPPQQSLIIVNCGMPATGRENWRASGARDGGAFDRHIQRHVLGRFVEVARRSSACSAARRWSAARARVGDARGSARRDRAARRRTTATPTVTASCMSARLCSPADGTRLDGEDMFLAADGSAQTAHRIRPICGALSSASVDQGQPAHRRPRRHADDAEPGSVDLQRAARTASRSRTASISAATRARAARSQIVIYGHARERRASPGDSAVHARRGTCRRAPRGACARTPRAETAALIRGGLRYACVCALAHAMTESQRVCKSSAMTEHPAPRHPRAAFRFRQDRA